MAQLKAFPLGRLITVATVRNSTKLVLGLIKNGVVDSKPIELKLCENNPPHRYLHYQNIQEKYIALGYDFTAEYLYCDICGKKFNVDDTVCASIKCDFDFCGSCAFFSVDREGATALKISKLVNNVALININNYLENMKDLKKFTNTISFQKNFEEFRNAKIDIGIPAAKLNNLCYQKLGIIINFILL